MAQNDTLIGWLNDAYGMEVSSKEMLQGHAKDFDEHPAIRAQILKHVEETERQAETLRSCIERLGGSVSGTKGLLGSLGGNLQAVGTGMYKDEKVKNLLSDYTAEQFEIASYTALIAGAETAGQEDVAQMCRDILGEELETARFLLDQIPPVVKGFIQTEAETA